MLTTICMYGAVFVALYSASGTADTVRINEVMASNGAIIADEDGDFEDWIELYNYGDTPVDLTGWGLSDTYSEPFKWVFPPNSFIDSNAYLLVWASGKNRSNAYLHTNFSVASAGEEVILTHPDGVRVDELSPREIPRDVSVGRLPGEGDGWFYFDEPTPGAANTTQPYAGLLAPVDFSYHAGFYTTSIVLSLTHPDPEATIIYTVDSSPPSLDAVGGLEYVYKNQYPQDPGDPFGASLTNNVYTHVYTHALYIDDNSPSPYIYSGINTRFTRAPRLPDENPFKATVVRARAIREGYLTRTPATHTYYVHPAMPRYTLPVISLAIDPSDFWGYEKGLYVPGKVADDWRESRPNTSLPLYMIPGNFSRRGRAWERAVHCEIFDDNGTRIIAQNAGIRIHGGATRSFPIKSLRLYARRHYDTRDTFAATLFHDHRRQGNTQEILNTYDRLILRQSGNDWDNTYYRDAFIQALVSHMPIAVQAYQPAVHFINGEYWGLINIRERMDDHYITAHYGVPKEEIAILTRADSIVDTGIAQDRSDFHTIREYVLTHDMSLSHTYAWVQERIDTDNLALYYAIQIYCNNTDWPHNNNDWWRRRTAQYEPNAPYGHDGRWRWLLYDTDFGFGLYTKGYDNDALGRVLSQTLGDVNRIFQRLVQHNEQFRTTFITYVADLMNSAFHPPRVVAVRDAFDARIAPYRDEHNNRWRVRLANRIRDFIHERPRYQRQHLRNHFSLSHDIHVTIDTSTLGGGYVRLNTIDITPETPGVSHPIYPWTGIYFSTIPLTFAAQPAAGYRFVAWHVVSDDGTTYTVTNTVYSQAFTTNVTVTAEYEPLPFEDVPLFLPDGDGDWTDDASWTSEIYPDGAGARTRIGAPVAGDRNINVRASITVGEITVEMTNTAYRNRIRDRDSGNTLAFACYSGVSRLVINGIGSGFFESDNEAGTHLANDLHITVNNITGDAAHGALRLRRGWSGPGGVVKDGAGVMSLTGEDKTYSGGTIISHGVLQVTEPATPVNTAFVRVDPGGQLRLTSAGDPRVYSFGGPLHLSSTGRQGVPADEGMGVLGALRYEPDSADNHAHVTTDIEVFDVSGIHVAGGANRMTLQGALSGSGSLIKSGGGTLTLTGDSSVYQGTLYISNGLVHVNNIMNTVAVSPGGALGGTGRVSHAHVESGGAISPGESIGALTIDTLIMEEGSYYDWEYAGDTADAIYAQSLVLPDTTGSVTVRVFSVTTAMTYPVTHTLFTYGGLQPPIDSLHFEVDNEELDVLVTQEESGIYVTVVPEPGVWSIILLGLFVKVRMRI